MKRVVVALSGGVDSGVAAVRLVDQGYHTSAVMLRLWAQSDEHHPTSQAVNRARALSDRLGIPFRLLDARQLFRKEVVEYFISEYAAARTPNPCIPCNRDIRFGFLLRWARRQGADFLATGHYARVRRQDGRYQLLRARDRAKDQSYVLHTLTQEQLAHVLFPLGELTKEDVRAIARERGLGVAGQPESQDVCFLAGEDYRPFLAQRAPEAVRPGPILDTSGQILGRHTGLVNYTIGQRKGIGVPAPHPLYVLALDRERNALIVGSAEELGHKECTVAQMHYISGEVPREPFSASAKIRYRHRAAAFTATPLPERRLRVSFKHPQRDITPGQYLVLYQGEVVLGGGVICA
jgi:tRNA-specific 2-thiouridylase